MKKSKKKSPVWTVMLRGTGMALGIDLAGAALLIWVLRKREY